MNQASKSNDAFPRAGMMRIMNDNLKWMFLCMMSSAQSRQPSPAWLRI
jgi:hypothetical protein